MPSPQEDVSSLKASMENFLLKPLPETMTELETEVTLIEAAQKRCDDMIRDLMSREDAREIFFPAEIHELHQQKNMLETHREFRRVRMRRLRLEADMR